VGKKKLIAFPPTEDIYQYGMMVSDAMHEPEATRVVPTWADYWRMKAAGELPPTTCSSKGGENE